MCFAVVWLLCSHSSAIPVVNLQDDGTFSANSYAMSRLTFNDDLEDFSLCFRIKLFRLRGTSNFVVSYAHNITDNALIASESDFRQ